jgi:hypothetical protein
MFSSGPTEHARLSSRQRGLAVDLAMALAAIAAFAHAASTPTQWRWWSAAGVLFAVIAIAQAALCMGLLRTPVRDRLLLLGAWGTVAVIALYVVSRTAGIPFAPPPLAHGSHFVPGRSIIQGAERYVGAVDVVTLSVEVVLVLVLTGLMTRALRQRTAAQLLWVGLLLWGLAGLSVL